MATGPYRNTSGTLHEVERESFLRISFEIKDNLLRKTVDERETASNDAEKFFWMSRGENNEDLARTSGEKMLSDFIVQVLEIWMCLFLNFSKSAEIFVQAQMYNINAIQY